MDLQVVFSDRELLCTLMDLRMVGCVGMSKEDRERAKELLEHEYVQFALRADAFDREQVVEVFDEVTFPHGPPLLCTVLFTLTHTSLFAQISTIVIWPKS
jgi:hypothetical protein